MRSVLTALVGMFLFFAIGCDRYWEQPAQVTLKDGTSFTCDYVYLYGHATQVDCFHATTHITGKGIDGKISISWKDIQELKLLPEKK